MIESLGSLNDICLHRIFPKRFDNLEPTFCQGLLKTPTAEDIFRVPSFLMLFGALKGFSCLFSSDSTSKGPAFRPVMDAKEALTCHRCGPRFPKTPQKSSSAIIVPQLIQLIFLEGSNDTAEKNSHSTFLR